MGKSQRTKGHAFEREVAAELRCALPGCEARRGLQFRDGAEAPDVIVPGLHIECKRGIKPNPRSALAQALADAGDTDAMAIAVVQDDYSPAFAVMAWGDLIGLLQLWWDAHGRGNSVRTTKTGGLRTG